MSELSEQREFDQIPDAPAPEQSSGLVGHRDVFERLTHQLAVDRLPGGIMLSGPRGIGKATLAFQLARQILTETGDEGAVRVDEQVAAGVHPNLFVLRRKLRDDQKAFYTVIRVEEVRKLIGHLRQTRGRAGHRVCVIDAMEDCNGGSANALLKTLEEPPADTHFILVTHRPGQLLPTIHSRCQAQPMRTLPDQDVTEVVRRIAGDDAENLQTAVELSGGRPRRALEALAVADNAALNQLRDWLRQPRAAQINIPLKLAEGLTGAKLTLENSFAREIIFDWIADEARQAAESGMPGRNRLASANALWEKANALFSDADIYNLDPRQTLMAIFDAIIKHDRLNSERISA